jgi:serine/threonine protein kinase
MRLAAGTRLGPYEITSLLGAGGMGEVYLAHDARLDRYVAIKILPDQFSSDSQRMARFEREAKVLASLNHPNIAAIYGLEESNHVPALVMELVDGPTLADRIKQGALPREDALPIAKQIAEALEYAHERSIIHRDLKPANVKITPNGAAKVLDFGLAKALEADASVTDISTSPTLSHAATQAGMLLGTAAYMSPEQARGKKVDRRADIWAFGVVLFEMLTGKPAFAGETISDTLAAVIRADPEWSTLPNDLPPSINRLLHRCLTKDPNQRLRDIGEARIAIDSALSATPEETYAPQAATIQQQRPPSWRRALPWALAAIAILLATTLSSVYWRARQTETEPRQVMQLSLALPEPLAGVFDPNPGSPFAISPDGSQIVFVASLAGKPQQLYLRPLDQQSGTPIAGTENASEPFFSPDGQWIGFFSLGKMRKVSLRGGPVAALCDAPVPHGASWAADDVIIYAPNFGSGLMRISAAGGTPQVLTTPNTKDQEISHRWPQVLPGGKFVLFTIQMGTEASYDSARIAVLSVPTGKWRTVIEGGSYARYLPSGHIVYVRGGALMGVAIDSSRMEVAGSPVPLQEGVVTSTLTSGGAEYDVTESGLLVYVPGNLKPPVRSLQWVDRAGVAKTLPAPARVYSSPSFSRDGKQAAMQINDDGVAAIWIYEFARNTLTRLTFDPNSRTIPLWSGDGRRVIYGVRLATASFRSKLADGSGEEEILSGKEFTDPGAAPQSASPDGKTLLFGATPAGRQAIYALSLDGTNSIHPFLQSSFNFSSAHFSPDGRWVAYMTDETGRRQIYVQPFPGPGGKWLISAEEGQYPRWSRNGREIFFVSGDKLMSVDVETQPAFKVGTPHPLFSTSGYLVGAGNYDVAPDGQHFLMIRQEEAAASPKELNVILNWSEELKRRALPAKK